MSAAFVACFAVGLVLAVYVMFTGVERRVAPSLVPPHEARGGHDPKSEPSVVLNAGNVAALLVATGLCGYLVRRFSPLGGLATAAIAIGVGVLVAVGSASLLAAWVLPGARHDVVDERYLMQGHPARVTRAIGGAVADDLAGGEIAYELDGRRFTVPARSWDDGPIESGVDVAIERIEDGVAYVERWAQVEARL